MIVPKFARTDITFNHIIQNKHFYNQ